MNFAPHGLRNHFGGFFRGEELTGWCCGFAAIPANMSSVATGGDFREEDGGGKGRNEKEETEG